MKRHWDDSPTTVAAAGCLLLVINLVWIVAVVSAVAVVIKAVFW